MAKAKKVKALIVNVHNPPAPGYQYRNSWDIDPAEVKEIVTNEPGLDDNEVLVVTHQRGSFKLTKDEAKALRK